MVKKKEYNPRNSNQIQTAYGKQWYHHYRTYLTSIAFQMFEWKGLPDSVSPKFLETSLHTFGYVGFYENPNFGMIAVNGSEVGLNIYNDPLKFEVSSHILTDSFEPYTYVDSQIKEGQGVVIYNNDMKRSTLIAIDMFAKELATTHEVLTVNMNAQKTPYIVKATKETKLSVMEAYNQVEGNALMLFVDENFDANSFGVFPTTAPYLVDKLNAHRMEIWNQALTYLGINNTNTGKKERMIVDEVQSNNDMTLNSGSVLLKTRLEACELINKRFGLSVSVGYRVVEAESSEKSNSITVNKEGENFE